MQQTGALRCFREIHRTLRAPNRFRVAALSILVIAIATSIPAQETRLTLEFADRIRISERSNLSRSEDGSYVGLMNRQVTGYLTRDSGAYNGRMLVFAETLRDMSVIGRPVDASFDGYVTVGATGGFSESVRVPRYLGIPFLPDKPISAGETWSAPGRLIIALPHDVPPLTVEVEVAYRYAGVQSFSGEPVHVIEAEFATRYPPPPDPEHGTGQAEAREPLRTDINRLIGRHSLGIQIPADSGAPFLIRDQLEEEYVMRGLPLTAVRGHTLLFVYGLSAGEQERIARDLEERLSTAETEGVVVEETATGTRITMEDIRFVADQAVILPEERGRLGMIAEALGSLPGTRYLVVGHTANVGSVASQIDLSWERARVIVAEFVSLGMDPTSFDLEGRGGSEPVAPNTTEEGRAQNRRVEIYVLEE